MSDFLTSLVDRALNRTPVLQRRRLSVFEPAVDGVTPVGGPFDNPFFQPDEEINSGSAARWPSNNLGAKSALEADSSNEPAQPRPPSRTIKSPRREDVTRREAAIAKEVRQMHEDSPSASSKTAEASLVSNVNPPTQPLDPTARATVRKVAAPPPRLIETIVERKVERQLVSEQSDNMQKNNRDQPGATPKPPVVIQARKLDQSAEIRSVPTATQQSEVRPVVQSLRPAKPRAREAAPVVRAASRFPSIRQAQAPAAPPTIHVTIGRIEVRATQPAVSKSPSAPAAAPKLSLEEYLRSRGGENR